MKWPDQNVSPETRDRILMLAETEKLGKRRVKEIIAQHKSSNTVKDIEPTTATIDIPRIEINDKPSNLIPFKRKTKGSAEMILELQSTQIKTIQEVCSELIDFFSEQEAFSN